MRDGYPEEEDPYQRVRLGPSSTLSLRFGGMHVGDEGTDVSFELRHETESGTTTDLIIHVKCEDPEKVRPADLIRGSG